MGISYLRDAILENSSEDSMAGSDSRLDQDNETNHLYRIVVDGQLHGSWSDWLGKVIIERSEQGVDSCHTILISAVPDQAALRGFLNHLWDLNLKLISVTKCEQGATDDE
jgi:hypothetical protein